MNPDDNRQYSKLTPAERQEEYLQLLGEKNRLKRHMSSKSRQEALNEERERGFSTHFAGANASGKPKKKKIVTGAGNIKLEDVTVPKAERPRRKWGDTDSGNGGVDGGGFGEFQIPHGEWGKGKASGSDRRWSHKPSPSDDYEVEEEGQAAAATGKASSEISEDEDEYDYEEDFEEDFDEEEELDSAAESTNEAAARPAASIDMEADSLRISAKSHSLVTARTSANAGASAYDSSVGGSKHKLRTEKEVVRLNSASGARPQSSGGYMSTPSDLNSLNWDPSAMADRPISNQSVLRASNSKYSNGPGSRGVQDFASMSLKPTATIVSPKKVKKDSISAENNTADSAVNLSSILDTSLIEKVADLDEKQKQKLLNLLTGGSGVVSEQKGNNVEAEAEMFTSTGSNLLKSPKWKESVNIGHNTRDSLASTYDLRTPRTFSLSQAATVPILRQDPAPGSKAIASSLQQQQQQLTAASGTMDGEMSISGMSEMFKTRDTPFSTVSSDASSSNIASSNHTDRLAETTSKLATVNESSEGVTSPFRTVTVPINCRIRIHNGWVEEKSKKRFISLRKLALRPAGSNVELDTTSLEVSLFCGLTPIAKSSESALNVRKLFSTSRFSGVDEWKGPYDTGNPLEIRLTGTMQMDSSLCDEALSASGSEPLLDGSMPSDVLELVIGNGLSLPARDADVYIGQKCVWSGCLDQLLNNGSSFSKKPDAQTLQSSLLIIPLRQKVRGATNKPRAELSPAASAMEIKSSLADPTAKPLARFDSKEALGSAPVWLSAKGEGRGGNVFSSSVVDTDAVNNGLGEFLRNSIQSKRKADDLVFDLIPEAAVVAPALDDYFGPMPRLDSAAPRSSHSKGRRHKKKEDDEALRQSLDALEHSDRLNRGRLRGGRRATREESICAGGMVGDLPLEDSLEVPSGIVISKKDADNLQRAALDHKAATRGETTKLAAQASSVEEISTVISPNRAAFQDRRLQKRSEKIDQVQETVRSALANLAGVMSNMNAPKSNTSKGSDQASPAAGSAAPNIRVSPLTVARDEQKKEQPFSADRSTLSLPKCAAVVESDEAEDTFSDLADEEGLQVISPESPDLVEPSPQEGSLDEIPVLPSGRQLRLEILSTWGDRYYVGLNGIDIFDSEGRILQYRPPHFDAKKSSRKGMVYSSVTISNISGNPSDINVLNEYENDPRHVTNLVEPINFTRDDMHVWLAPRDEMFYEKEYDSSRKSNRNEKSVTYIVDTMGKQQALLATVTIDFSAEVSISMIRIWNYNKSRTHCMRGVRRARLILESAVIFDGEIRIAPGTLETADACSEVILFSTDMKILANVAKHDSLAGYNGETKALEVDEAAQQWLKNMNHRKQLQRPRTADKSDRDDVLDSSTDLMSSMQKYGNNLARPTTSAAGSRRSIINLSESAEFMNSLHDQLIGTADNTSFDDTRSKRSEREFTTKARNSAPKGLMNGDTLLSALDLISVKVLSLTIESTWGDKSYTGLNGIEVLTGCECISLDIGANAIDADPRDLSVIGCFDDVRTPDKLVDGVNDTTNESHMWLIPFSKGSCHRITINLGATCKVAGIRIWNYNKSAEDSLRGARIMSVWADDKFVGQFVARIAPGCDGINFGHTILFKNLGKFCGPSPVASGKLGRGPGQNVSYITPAIRQTYETPNLPRGMHWKFSIYSNWGDSYYVGLDALEFLDEAGEAISVLPVAGFGDGLLFAATSTNALTPPKKTNYNETVSALITAVPYSVQDLVKDSEQGQSDADQRTPSNLFNGVNRDSSGHNSWLAPIAHCMGHQERQYRGDFMLRSQKGWDRNSKNGNNQHDENIYSYFHDNMLYVLFDYPVTVSAIRIYNYSKNPTRGARDFTVEVDDRMLYMGVIEAALDDSKYSNTLNDSKNTMGACTILFTNDPKIVKSEKDKVQYCGTTDQDVLHIDERKVMVRSKGMFDKPSPTTEGVITDVLQRPTTAIART